MNDEATIACTLCGNENPTRRVPNGEMYDASHAHSALACERCYEKIMRRASVTFPCAGHILGPECDRPLPRDAEGCAVACIDRWKEAFDVVAAKTEDRGKR